MDAALVELIENHDVEVGEQWIRLQSCRQDSFRGDEKLRLIGKAALETDLPSDLVAESPVVLEGDAASEGARRHTPWLQDDRSAELRECGGDARCLTRARRGDDDRAPLAAHELDDLMYMRIDREWLGTLHATDQIMKKDDIDYTAEGNTPPQEKDDPTNAGYDEAAHSGPSKFGVLEGEGGVFGTTGGGTANIGQHVDEESKK